MKKIKSDAMNKISVIVPVFNAQKYLKRCLDSLVNNKECLYEVILVDDGSTDNSSIICKDYQNRFNFIRYYYQSNHGPSAARNYGLKMVKGKYIMFVDSDDFVDDLTYLYEIINTISSDYFILPNIHKLINGHSINKTAKNVEGIHLTDDRKLIKTLIKEEKINSPWSKIYKKEILDKANICFDEDVNIAEDLLFNIDYLCECSNFFIGNNIIYNYCFNDNSSLTKKYLPNKYETLMQVNRKLKESLEQLGVASAYSYLVYKNIFSSVKDLSHNDCNLSNIDKIGRIKMYKNENNNTLVFGYGIKIFLWSLAFNLLPVKLIYLLFH